MVAMRSHQTYLPFLFSLSLSVSLTAPSVASPSETTVIQAELDAMVEDEAAIGVVGVVQRGDETIFSGVAGDLERGGAVMKVDSIFRIFSMSKPVTAVAALTLLDEGKFGLDDPLVDYLPEFAATRVTDPADRSKTVPLDRPLLVRDLFQHTAGWNYEVPWRARAKKNGVDDPDLAAMVTAVAALPLQFQPGSRWEYGISNDLLGAFIEVVAEQSLDAVMNERIFAPLGMIDTGFFVDEQKLDRLATLHVNGGDGLVPAIGPFVGDPTRKPALLEGGAGLYSTAGDYLRFMRMLANGGAFDGNRVLKEETVALMMTDQLGDIPRSGTLTGRDWGLGIAITVADGDVGTPGSWTWGGAAGTSFWIDPATDTRAIFLVQNWFDFVPAFRFAAALDRAPH